MSVLSVLVFRCCLKLSLTIPGVGYCALSRNAAPYFGEIAPGIFAAVCQNGLGVARGTIAGKLLAEYALGEDNELVRDILSYPQPCRNPPPPLLGLGVSATIAWKAWRAGRER